MLSYEESLKILRKTNALLEGHFILSSGLHSKQYIQCAQLLSHPHEAELISVSLSSKIKEKFSNIDIILSPAIGGIVIGYEVGQQLNVKSIFAERENGKLLLRRGFSLTKNSNVLIVEDVITTGKSALECSELVYENGANLIGYACIIDRTKGNIFKDHQIISQLKFDIKTYTKDNLPKEIKNTVALKPGSRNITK
jgi:orotate phosphoribosyltransferase